MDLSDLPTLFLIGIFLLLGWVAHVLGSRAYVPRVTLLLTIGLLAGPSGFDLIPHNVESWFPLITEVALAMIGFLLGETLVGRHLPELGRTVLFVSLGSTLGSALAVFFILLALGAPFIVALILAGIAPATAPAATMDIIKENHAKGPLTETILGVVAVDDAWGVILFSFLLMAATAIAGAAGAGEALELGLWHVGGAGLLGLLLGLPMAALTGRMKPGEPTLVEAAAFVFLCGGLASLLGVSHLLACMVLGATVAWRAKHHTRPFREIEGASEPFLVMFFLLAGYSFEIANLKGLGLIGVGYLAARSVGRILASRMAAKWAHAPAEVQSRIGWCLLPQAGVALGLTLLASERIPDLRDTVLPVIIATTIIFEVIGPISTHWHLRHAGEIGAGRTST